MAARITGIAVALALAGAAPAAAQSPYPPGQPYATWDGTNPFNCTLQDAGTGSIPDNGDDPYCVEFDKTQQNITDFGILDFLANEPQRFANAGTKCFYFQSDHWTGSFIQGNPSTEIWHWDGQYFFDRALGVGGVNVKNFRIGSQPASPSSYGEVPPEFAPYMDQGGGGSYIISQQSQVDPACYARVDTPAEQAQVYANGLPPLGITNGQTGAAAGPSNFRPTASAKCRRHKGKRKQHAHSAKGKRGKKCGKRKRRHKTGRS